jgi:hypothetical protein
LPTDDALAYLIAQLNEKRLRRMVLQIKGDGSKIQHIGLVK